MARSISFVLDGEVDTQISITEQADGTLLFDIEVLDSGKIGDLRALYFDLEGVDVDSLTLQATGDDVTDTAFDEAGVDNLGLGTAIGHDVTNDLGDFDVGIEFGTITPFVDDIQQTSFVLSADTALSLDMLDLADVGLRYGFVEGIFGWRLFPEKIGGETSGVAQDDLITVDEGGSDSLDLLANDTGGAGRTVTAVDGNTVVGPSGAFEIDVTVDGKTYGTLQVATDGTASFTADGPDAAALEDGESVVFATAYETVGADGSTASAGLEIVVNGLGQMNSDPLAVDDVDYQTNVDAVLNTAALGLSVLDNDSDPDGDPLVVSAVEGSAAGVGAVVTLASGALLTLNADGTFDYDPNGAFDALQFGQSAQDSFEYTISDDEGATATATATVTVAGVNRAPATEDELYYETGSNAVLHSADLTPVFEEAMSVLDNDSDPDGDPLTVSAVEGSAAGVGAAVTLASGALVTLNADGTFDYDPNGAFDALGFGEYAEDRFDYTVADGNGGTATATATVTVGGVGLFDTNLAPIDFEDVTTDPAAPIDTYAGFAWSAPGGQFGAVTVDFLEAQAFWDGLAHTMLNQTGGEYLANTHQETVSVTSADGSDFDFAGGWFGALKATDENGEISGSELPSYFTVSGYRDGMLVDSETAVLTSAEPVAFIAADFQDIDLLTFESNGIGDIVFDDLYMARIPDVADELYYETDADAVLHSADLMRDSSVPFLVYDEVRSVLDNDSDPDGGSLTVSAVEGSAAGVGTAVTLASGALLTLNADGTFDYDPNGAFDALGFGEYEQDSFEYTVANDKGGTATATATVTVGGTGAFEPTLALIDFEDVTTDPAAPFTTHAGFVWSPSEGGSMGAATVDFLQTNAAWDDTFAPAMLNQTGGEYLVVPNNNNDEMVSVTSADGSDFDFAGGWFGALKDTDSQIGAYPPSSLTVSGYRDGVLVDSETAVLTVDQPVAFIALDLQGIDLLTIENSSPIAAIAFDDLYMMA